MITFPLLFLLISCTAARYCPGDGFTLVNDLKCLKLFSAKPHLDAESTCLGYGGFLATSRSAIDNRVISNLAANAGFDMVWIGVTCYATGSNITCYDDRFGYENNYMNFAAGTLQVKDNWGCVGLTTSTGQWRSELCEVIGMPFICEIPESRSETCLHNYNDNCYTLSQEISDRDDRSTFFEAQRSCHRVRSELVSIYSQLELNYVLSLYQSLPVKSIYLGLQGNIWTDYNEPLYFNYFNPLVPRQENCSQMDLFDTPVRGLWYDSPCDEVMYFLCKRPNLGRLESGTQSVSRNVPVTELSEASSHRDELVDNSKCNQTIIMAPGTFTSFGYNSSEFPATFCSWNLAAFGPYRIALYFTDFSVYDFVNIYDEYGILVDSLRYNSSTTFLSHSNVLTVTHNSSLDVVHQYPGFKATILQY